MIHNIAHRGASAYEPENTLRAFERAIEMGATMIELDVYLTQDGHVVVSHDADLSTGRIQEMTLAQVQQIDVGQGEHIPTLAEVIDHVRGRTELYIELKGQWTPEPVVRTLHARSFTDSAIVGSFYPWLPQKAKFLAPTLRTSILIGQEHIPSDDTRRPAFVEWALAVEAERVHLCWERASPTPHRLLTPALLEGIRAAGLGIVLWHEEHVDVLRALVELDVDGICTNTPDVLTEILQAKER